MRIKNFSCIITQNFKTKFEATLKKITNKKGILKIKMAAKKKTRDK